MRVVTEPALRFALVRSALGLYLAWDLARLSPYAGRLYGVDGLVGALEGPLPAPLALSARVLSHGDVLLALALVALGLAAGVQRRLAAAVLWAGWAMVLNGTPWISAPSDGYVGWLLVCMALVPSGEPRRPGARSADGWELPRPVLPAAWLALAAGYAASGLGKLASPAWLDGGALAEVLAGPVARDSALVEVVAGLPEPLLRAGTWGVLGLELLFAPCCLWGPARAVAWGAMALLHLCVALLLDIEAVSVAMLIFHLLVWEERWLARPRPS
jgi:hypothetical protein